MGDLIRMGDAFKSSAPVIFNEPDDDQLSSGIATGYGVLKYRGKHWSIQYKGENKYFLRPDDRTPVSYIDVIILRSSPLPSKSYYPGGYDEAASAGERPTCASITGVVPDLDVKAKQADACNLCPRNEWRQKENGRRGKECTDYKRTAVLIMPSSAVLAVGEPIMEPVFLRIPPASLKHVAAYGDHLSQMGHRYYGVVTRISFKMEVATPEFVFEGVQPLTDKEKPLILQLRNDPLTLRITGEDMQARLQAGLPEKQGVGGGTPVSPFQALPETRREAPMEIIPPAGKAETPHAPGPAPVLQGTPAVPRVDNPGATVATAAAAGLGLVDPAVPGQLATKTPEGLGLMEAVAQSGNAQKVAATPTPAAVGQTKADIGDGGPQFAALDSKLASLLGEAGVLPQR